MEKDSPGVVVSVVVVATGLTVVRAFLPRNLRRTFLSDLQDGGTEVVTVQEMAGRANVQTNIRCGRGAATRKAVELLMIPDTTSKQICQTRSFHRGQGRNRMGVCWLKCWTKRELKTSTTISISGSPPALRKPCLVCSTNPTVIVKKQG